MYAIMLLVLVAVLAELDTRSADVRGDDAHRQRAGEEHDDAGPSPPRAGIGREFKR